MNLIQQSKVFLISHYLLLHLLSVLYLLHLKFCEQEFVGNALVFLTCV